MACLVCSSVRREKRISPAPCIYHGKYWDVEHGYPSNYTGWIVLVLRRHAEALHQLSTEEFLELIHLQEFCVKLMHKKLKSEKENIFILCEKPEFTHLHVHIIPVAYDLPASQRGIHLLSLVHSSEKDVQQNALISFCKTLQTDFSVLSKND